MLVRTINRKMFCIDTSTAEIPQLFYLTRVIVEVGGHARANLCGPSCSAGDSLVSSVFELYGLVDSGDGKA